MKRSSVGGWLCVIARNKAIDFLRAQKKHEPLPDEVATEEVNLRLEAQEALHAIRQLPDAYREALIMRLCEGMSGPEIAECTGLTPGSVRVNLHRGMKLLRAQLGGGQPDEQE